MHSTLERALFSAFSAAVIAALILLAPSFKPNPVEVQAVDCGHNQPLKVVRLHNPTGQQIARVCQEAK